MGRPDLVDRLAGHPAGGRRDPHVPFGANSSGGRRCRIGYHPGLPAVFALTLRNPDRLSPLGPDDSLPSLGLAGVGAGSLAQLLPGGGHRSAVWN